MFCLPKSGINENGGKNINPSKIDAMCAKDMWKINFMLDFSTFRIIKGNFQSDAEFARLWINSKRHDIFNTIFNCRTEKNEWSAQWSAQWSAHGLHSLHGLHDLQSAVCSLHGLRFGVTVLSTTKLNIFKQI